MKYALIALILAFTGINYEFLISQYITANIGGTFFQYSVTLAAFTFSLGLGSILFLRMNRSRLQVRILGFLQIGVALLALALPAFFEWSDPLSRPEQFRWCWILLSYSPAVLFGCLTGFEIPFLMQLDKQRPIRILAFDFIGMFIGTLIFPTYLIYKFGLPGSLQLCSILNGLCGFWLLCCPTQLELDTAPFKEGTVRELFRSKHSVYLLLAFVLSFCSFSYEILLAKVIMATLGDNLINQVFLIGIFILGLGIGSLWAETIPFQKSLRKLIQTEFIISIVAASVPVLVFLIASTLELYFHNLINYAQEIYRIPLRLILFMPVPFSLGFLSGMELPLLMFSLNLTGSERQSVPLISMNYLGALLGGTLTVALLIPRFGSILCITVISLINIIALYGLTFMDQSCSKLRRAALSYISLGVAFFALYYQPDFQDTYLKIHYQHLSLREFSFEAFRNLSGALSQIAPITRIESKYQIIDLVDNTQTRIPMSENSFSLFLNGFPQFSSDYWQTYHESFVWGALNLSREKPRSVLVLGGGDGLLVRELLEIEEIREITLIELDSEMIQLANNHSQFTRLNRYALENPRVKTLIDDAFRYSKENASSSNPQKYDGIFIDFPYPNNYDLSRLYSLEFYNLLTKLLNPNGFIILDAPLSQNIDYVDPQDARRQTTLISTLKAAGFSSILPFGPFDPFLFATTADKKLLEFHYADIPKSISDRAFINLKTIEHVLDQNQFSKDLINSIFWPKWLD